jgi:CheY-like chemotaxis protein
MPSEALDWPRLAGLALSRQVEVAGKVCVRRVPVSAHLAVRLNARRRAFPWPGDARLSGQGPMSVVLICLADPGADGLERTLLWRSDLRRHLAASAAEARALLGALHPTLIVIDRDLPDAEVLVRDVRADECARVASIVVAARGDLRPSELALLDAGANAVLRLPGGPEWDERLARLTQVPLRKALRLPVHLELQGRTLLDLASASGTILNVSTTGMLIECDRPLDLGTEVSFSFCPPAAPSVIVGQGRIVRLAGAGRVGVEFFDLDAAAARTITSLGA